MRADDNEEGQEDGKQSKPFEQLAKEYSSSGDSLWFCQLCAETWDGYDDNQFALWDGTRNNVCHDCYPGGEHGDSEGLALVHVRKRELAAIERAQVARDEAKVRAELKRKQKSVSSSAAASSGTDDKTEAPAAKRPRAT